MSRLKAFKAMLVVTSALTGVGAVQAADDEIEEFVVTAGRRVQPAADVAKSIAVIGEEALKEGQYSFVVDALQTLPGVAINQNGAFGGVATVSIRGAATDQTVVLIDGVQVNDPSSVGGAFDFSTLDPQGIERIEVLRGPQAVLYGSDAIGGVINIITRRGSEGFGGDAFAEYGAFDSLHLGGNAYGGTDRIGFNLSASFKDADGISAADEADGNAETDGFESLNLRGKFHAKLGENTGFELTSSYTDSKNDYDGFAFTDGAYKLSDTDDNSTSEEFSMAGRFTFGLLEGKVSNTLSVEYSSIDRKNYAGDIFTYGAEGERLNFDYLAIAELAEGWTLTAGVQHEEIKAKTVDPEAISTDSLFGTLTYSKIKGLTLSGGVRVDDHETFGTTTNGELNASYRIEGAGTQITAAWGEGFKAPTIFQLTFACCGFAANPLLDPERSDAWEVGVKQPFLDNRVTLAAAYFNQDTDNLIIFTYTDGYQNISRTSAKGLELSLDASMTDTFGIIANYTHVSARDLDTGARLSNRPRDEFFASLRWQPLEKLKATLSVTHNGKELDSSGLTVDAWTRVDLRASYALSDMLELYGRIDNLFDEGYQQVLGYGTPGVSAYAGIRARF